MTNTDEEPNQFVLPFTREEIRDLHTMLEWVADQKIPFMTEEYLEARWKIRNARRNGCFIHGVISGKFRISPNETITICPDCDPVTFGNLVKDGHECIRIPTKFGIPMTDTGLAEEE